MKLLFWRKSKPEPVLDIKAIEQFSKTEAKGLAILLLDIRSNLLSPESDRFLRFLDINPLDYLGAKADIPMPNREKIKLMRLAKGSTARRPKVVEAKPRRSK